MPGMKWFFGSLQPTHDAAPARRARARVQARARRVHQNRIYADILALLRQDLANVEAGIPSRAIQTDHC